MNDDLIPAVLKDDDLIESIRTTDTADGFSIWWLGQSGFLLKWNGEFLLFDPYLSDSLTRKYATTDKPHTRMSELVINPAKLDFVPVVTSSHNHTDHLDAETLQALAAANAGIELILPEANIDFAHERLGNSTWIQYTGIDTGESKQTGPWKFTGITAAHNEVERNENGHSHFMGFVVEFGPYCVYHSGDTLLHETIISELSPFSINVAMLPINGNKPERRVAGNLNGTEAARLGKDISAGIVIPCHYHMFTFNTAEPEEFVSICEKIGQRFQVMRGGERLDFTG